MPRLSIPEFPAETVNADGSRHYEVRELLVNLSEDVANLVARHSSQDPDLYEAGEHMARRGSPGAICNGESDGSAIFVNRRKLESE